MEPLSDLIRARRALLGISDETAAHQVGVTGATFARWRKGKFLPEPDKVPALARWLGVSESDVRAAIDMGQPPSMADVAAQLQELGARIAELDRRVGGLGPREHERGRTTLPL